MAEEKECCPRFDPEPWQEVTHEWYEKPFMKTAIPQFMHMPLPGVLNRGIQRLWKEAGERGIAPETKDFLLLAYDPSPWKSELYLAVTKDAPAGTAAEPVRLSGTYVSKVFDGPYNAVPRYIGEFNAFLAGKGKSAKRFYFYYTTCPKCAKKYGHNYIVAFAEV